MPQQTYLYDYVNYSNLFPSGQIQAEDMMGTGDAMENIDPGVPDFAKPRPPKKSS